MIHWRDLLAQFLEYTPMPYRDIPDIDDALNQSGVSVRELYAVYDQRQPVPEAPTRKSAGAHLTEARQIPWLQDNISRALLFTNRALEKEEFLLVCDVARETIRHWKGASDEEKTELVKVRMNYASALARLGFTRAAREELEPCSRDDFELKLGKKLRAEIFLRLGNILRDESRHAHARAAKIRTATDALEFYKQALALEPARLDALALTAAASLVLGEPGSDLRRQAHEKAQEILKIAEERDDSEGPRMQTARARATAFAVLGKLDRAMECYDELQRIRGVTTMDLADARYYARFLAEASGQPREFFSKAFPPLQLVVFVGHLPDLPGKQVRFPLASVEQVRGEIRKKLDEMDVRVGLVGAAAGADLLFVEALLERQGTVHLVLPWSRDEFRKTSVTPYEPQGAPPIWAPIFDRALKEAATVREVGQVYEPGSEVSHGYMMEVTAGLALHTARVSRLEVQPLVLWDGRPGWARGSTASFFEFWIAALCKKPLLIPLPAAAALVEEPISEWVGRRCELPTMHQEVKSMLFADIVGYSKLTEHVIPEFIETFMARVSQLAASSKHAPRSLNTWGDAVYAIFDFARNAGCFALELIQMIEEGKAEWLQKGLYWEEYAGEDKEPKKHPLNIRIGLHTGPVFMHYDSVVRRLGFTGAHVNRAARIEPVAKPGEVFASEEFAALAELDAEIQRRQNGARDGEEGTGFVCEYAGSMHLAKGYPGRFRIYRVMPNRVFAVEELAKAAHEAYCAEAKARGETPASNSSMRPWADLSEDLRDPNRAQVADIPNKLRFLGYELAPSYGILPSEISSTDAQLEELAIREHDRWMKDKLEHGWTYGPKRDNGRKQHPLIVPWGKLSELEKEKDRDTVRNLPHLIEKAGFRVRKIAVMK